MSHKIDEIYLSEKSLEDYVKMLENKAKEYEQISKNIANRLAKESSVDTYSDIQVIPAVIENGQAVAYVRTTNEKDTYQEFGTGIVGSRNPHIDEVLSKAGWKYDVNEHGELGWFYPKEDGTFGWTKGQVAKMKLYKATEKAREKSLEIAKEEFSKYN